MSTTEGHDLGTTEAEFHVPRLLRAAEVLCSDGRVLRGRVFLPATADSRAGAMRAEEWMNEPAGFFPFLPDGEGRPVILNKAQVAVVTVAASADRDETPDEVGPPMKRVRVECGALRLEGEVLVDMPAHQSRVLDLLNRPGAFLNVREGGRHHLVRKSGITRVSEPAPPRPRP
ncbi:MAG TPA: hypothetical protein VLL75_04230 [Vicinamibacteria bacterium]|nr:hypothetical protein [Vicinamibacteria bacterium]